VSQRDSPTPDTQETDWSERRHNPPHTLSEAVTLIEDKLDERIIAHLETHNLMQQNRQDLMMREMREGITRLEELILAGFPDNDPVAHRKYHQDSMEFYRDMKDLAKEVRNHTIKGVVWAALILVGLAVWQLVKVKVGQP